MIYNLKIVINKIFIKSNWKDKSKDFLTSNKNNWENKCKVSEKRLED